MILFRFHKKILKSIIILIFFIIIINLTTFYLSDTVISNRKTNSKTSETLFHLPTLLQYIWLQSATVFIPEEDTIIMMKSFNQYTGYTPSFLFNDFNTITPWVGIKLSLFMMLSSFKRIQNTNATNAIPLGGHAPPY